MWRTIARAFLGTPSHWVADRASPVCMSCDESWSTWNRRHHCRACGKVVCGGCWDKERGMRCTVCLLTEDVELWGPHMVASVAGGGARLEVVFYTDTGGVRRALVVATDDPNVLPVGAWLLSVGGRVATVDTVHALKMRKGGVYEVRFVPRALAGLVVEIYSPQDLDIPVRLERRPVADEGSLDALHYATDEWSLRCVSDGATRRWVVRKHAEKVARSAAMTALHLPQDISAWEYYDAKQRRWGPVDAAFVPTDATVRIGGKVAILTDVIPRRVWCGGTVDDYAPRYTGPQVAVRFDRRLFAQEVVNGRHGRLVPDVPLGVEVPTPELGKRRKSKKEKKAGSSRRYPAATPPQTPPATPPHVHAVVTPKEKKKVSPRRVGVATATPPRVAVTPPATPPSCVAGAPDRVLRHADSRRSENGKATPLQVPATPPSCFEVVAARLNSTVTATSFATPDRVRNCSVISSACGSAVLDFGESDDEEELLGSVTSTRARPPRARRPPSSVGSTPLATPTAADAPGRHTPFAPPTPPAGVDAEETSMLSTPRRARPAGRRPPPTPPRC